VPAETDDLRPQAPAPSTSPSTGPSPSPESDQPGPLPAIHLPKGGGAIRGIGEKFSVNTATGSGSVTVPIATSPGRGGFGPQLTLSYDSGSANGPFGFGWSLGLPSITRKTDKGLPRYRDDDESDVFLISDAEDLVPVLDNAGSRVKFLRTLHKVAYTVRPYRPRIEGMFARVERWTDNTTGLSHWRTITKEDVTTLFGLDDNSRIADPDGQRIFSYLIAFTFDGKGNAMEYSYIKEDSRQVDTAAPHEANRTPSGRAVQRYVKYIRYGNFTPYFPDWSTNGVDAPRPQEWRFLVLFDYGDHSTATPTLAPDTPWPVRPDALSQYRATYEVRTYRRVKRVAQFHNFPEEPLIGADCPVRSMDFVYSDETTPTDPANPVYTFLESVSQSGYKNTGKGFATASAPPLEFFYSQPKVQPDVFTLEDTASLAGLPEGIDGSRFQLFDLNGEGLSGILRDEDGSWSYKRNLSPLNSAIVSGEPQARAQFDVPVAVAKIPVPSHFSQGQQLLDLTGAGLADVVALDGPAAGYFARTEDEDWEPFRAFSSLPRIDWSQANLRFIDLTGDGLADVLITEDDVFTFYQSLGRDGFGEQQRVYLPSDEEHGPRVVFASGDQTISLADMSGDGMRGLVRIRNGEVCYWPNLGYGRFGAKITMDRSPRFTDDERFDATRIRLADIDGSGTTDLIYLGHDGVQVCFNRSGNSFADPQLLAVFSTADDVGGVQVTDLLGNGTACLVWSSPLPAESQKALRYVDLMGSQKPHLLVRMRNNLGAETRVAYSSSTKFYLKDQRDGKPWITKLAFPVHVAERVESYDWIGRSRFVSRYAFHHGYFDGVEREFRGFGMVEQRDTDQHRDDTLFPGVPVSNEDGASSVPPILTRTWIHTGAFPEAGVISQQYRHECWQEPALTPVEQAALLIPDTVMPAGLTAEEMREAYRALKGSTLRVEVYAEDGTPQAQNPYTVTESNFSVQRIQGFGENRHAVFLKSPRESISYQYERRANDPRVKHDFTLETDGFGNVVRAVAVTYSRRAGYPEPEPTLSAQFRSMLQHDQTRLHINATQNLYTTKINDPADATVFDSFRGPMASETLSAELTGIAPAGRIFLFAEIDGKYTTLWAGASDIAYEDVASSDIDGTPAAASPARRIVEHTRTLYRADDLSGLEPPGTSGALALPGDTYKLALTPALVSRIFGARVNNSMLVEGGYAQLAPENNWWIPKGRTFYSAGDADTPAQELAAARAHFFLPRRSVDPFGAIARVGYDPYDLLPIATTDPAGNVSQAQNDYRILSPTLLTDANQNTSGAAFDILGRVAGTMVAGKAGEGDSLAGFNADLTDPQIAAVRANPLAGPASLLGSASSRYVYDLFAYFRSRDLPTPDAPMVYSLTRETHVSDLAGGSTRFQHAFSYSDGLGREAQRKAQAEPGPVSGIAGVVNPRWTATGWTIFNNKGKAVRTFEPFFSNTHLFQFNPQIGVSSVQFYDPLDRVVGSLHPDNTFEKTAFGAWRQEIWDGNDTVMIADPTADSDVGGFFTRLFAPGAYVSWHDRRIGGNWGSTPEEKAANQDAAQKATLHAGTPGVKHFDSLGRTCLAVADNSSARFATRTALDTAGKPLALIDPLGRRVAESCVREPNGGGFRYVAGFDMAGRALYSHSSDSGERRILNDIAGKPIYTFTARGFVFHNQFDVLRRPTHVFVSNNGAAPILLERSIYGDRHPDATLYLKGKLYRHYDSSGVSTTERCDFKGNPLATTRQLAAAYTSAVDWSPLNIVADVPTLNTAAIDGASAGLLDPLNRFTASTRFDALNRPVQVVTPHSATGRPSVIQPQYNDAHLLEAVDVWIRQAADPAALLNPATADLHAVTGIAYNARGQRLECDLGNGATITYTYDAETFRMTNLTTVGPNPDPNAQSVQLLDYTYDPVGNVTGIRDSADIHNVIYFRNQRVEPSASYAYDALYRLISASGREHLGQNGNVLRPAQQISNDDSFRAALLNPGDGNAMGNYTELYAYDAANNIQSIIHQVASGGWTRRYSYTEASVIDPAETSNRLSATSQPADNPAGPFSDRYAYDVHGSMVAMPHLPSMTWNESDRLQSTARQVVNAGTPETSYYIYDASGDRARKVTNWQASTAKKSERIYLGPFEIYREFAADGATITLERETLHVMEEQRRAAIVETRTIGNDGTPAQLVRFQFGNHLGSSAVELDSNADVISYEEYFPFGASSYRAGRTVGEVLLKRYRYTGKEHDTENDFNYHGARYCASWLGRWISPDPAGLGDGNNVYSYTSNNPVRMIDPNGKEGKETDSGIIKADIGEVFRSPEWKAAIKKARAYQPKLMSRDEERAWREAREAKAEADEAAKKASQQKTDSPPAEAPNTDPPQSFSPPGATYQSAPTQPRGGFSLGGYWQYLYLNNYASQYAANGGLLAPGGNFGLELLVQGTHTIDPSGNNAGSVTGGIHGAYGPEGHMYNLALYLLFSNTLNNPAGTDRNFGFTATAVAERLIGRDRDHPWLTLGLNVTGSYLQYLNVSPVGAPPTAPSTVLGDSGAVGGVGNATLSFLYAGKTPRLQIWAEGYGSYASGTPGHDSTGAPLPGGSIVVGGGAGGVTGNIPLTANGYNILTIGAFAGDRYERDQVGSSVTQSSQLYIGGGAGFARRFW
jgi:RHS repeat-associated protein